MVEHRRLDVGSDDTGAVMREDGADGSGAGAGIEHQSAGEGERAAVDEVSASGP